MSAASREVRRAARDEGLPGRRCGAPPRDEGRAPAEARRAARNQGRAVRPRPNRPNRIDVVAHPTQFFD